jgi:peptide/nickel transport system substrate-binding protein
VSCEPHEAALRRAIEGVRRGALPRRAFIAQMAALGLGAPTAGMLLLQAGVAQAQAEAPYPPTQRGGGGALKLLFWQGPTLLNPHFATGDKDEEGARLFYEPLAAWDAEGRLVPMLAAEIPSRDNGGVAADGKSVVWKLRPGVQWHDGQPFSADDVVFNAQFASDPAAAAVTLGAYQGLKFEKLGPLTVRVVFDKPTPFWAGTYARTQLLPRHVFAAYQGARSREAPANLKPIGTGPYLCTDFKPGDLVRGRLNPNYHRPNRPHFDTVELKGGGDAVSAARAVLQTGEYDFAWNLQVEDEILLRLETGGKGRVHLAAGGAVEQILLNAADPNTAIDGERAHARSRHPAFSDPAVRQAFALLVDRQSVQKHIYGRAGVATANILNNPAALRSPNQKMNFSVDQANALLDAAGWQRGTDGIRAKGGTRMRWVFQTSTNAPRQKTQQIVKQAARAAGIELELKSVVPAVYFSSDVANPDTASKFWADIQMLTNSMGMPDAARFMQQYVSWEISSKANKWSGLNRTRWQNADYDRAWRAAETELDAVKRAALFIRMNDLACQGGHVVPLVFRPDVIGASLRLKAHFSGWENALGFVHDWYRG